MNGRGRWLIHDHAILRSTGFPWTLLDALDRPETNAAVDELERAEALLEEAVTAMVAAVRAEPDVVTPRQSRRLRKALSRHSAIPDGTLTGEGFPTVCAAAKRYGQRLSEVEAAWRTAEQHTAEESARSHRAILHAASAPAVREALWLSSPAMHDRGLRELANLADRPQRGPARKARRQVGGYLQRLAAKNETTSFFGPVNYAEFGLEPDGVTPLTADPTRRCVALAHWAVLVLADAVAADPAVQPHLKPRGSGLLTSSDPPHAAGRQLRLPPLTRRLLRSVDGRRSVLELAALLDEPAEHLLRTTQRAAERGLLMLDCRPPVTVTDPLGWLRDVVAALPEDRGWTAVLDRVRERLDAFAAAGLEGRRKLLDDLERDIGEFTDGPVRRGGGQWYADRLVVHEEALGNITPLPLGRALQESLRTRLSSALDLLAAEGVARHARLTARFLKRHPELAKGGTVPLLALLRAEPDSQPPPEGPLTAAGRHVAEMVEQAPVDRPVRIDPDDLPACDLGADPLIASPDLMFSCSGLEQLLAGDGETVLAECHDTMLVWGWALQFHRRRGQVEQAGAELLRRAAPDTTMGIVLGSRRAKIVPFDFPGPAVDLGSTMPGDDRLRIRAADVGVRLSGGRLVCTTPEGSEFLLHHGELDSDVHNVLAPPRVRPVTFGRARRTPRVLLGDIVLARAAWRLSPEELFPPGEATPSEIAMLRYARAAARELDIPQRCFLKVPGERKPVLLDLRAPALLDLGRHLGRGQEEVVLTELLPDPDGLWLHGREGRHCAELRTTVVYERRADDGGDGCP